jgi:hypothetical protein
VFRLSLNCAAMQNRGGSPIEYGLPRNNATLADRFL